MSADSHTVCPKCHPEVLERVGVMPTIGEELGLPEDVREYYEYYMQNLIPEGPRLVCEYSADCWTCGWHFEITHTDSLIGLEKEE